MKRLIETCYEVIEIPDPVKSLPDEGRFNLEEKTWYGGENSGGWVGWEKEIFVSPTNHSKVFRVEEREYFVNTSSYSRYEDDKERKKEYLVRLIN